MRTRIESVIAAIDFIETHLSENLDLNRIAEAVHYSKYYLHRMFVNEVGLTIHDYVQRRQLTEAARLLIFSAKPILEIALLAGYESQQAFTSIFKEMYKKTPGQYREDEMFYPLQLRFILNRNPMKFNGASEWQKRITFAVEEDILPWMDLVRLVIDGFPYLDEEDYVVRLKGYIEHRRALILKDGEIAVGVMLFHEEFQGEICGEMQGKFLEGIYQEMRSIDFLGVHPQYKKQEIIKAFLAWLREERADIAVTMTTFREGDKADTGYREVFMGLGFAEAELLVEFGYPTQRLIWQQENWEGWDDE